MSDETAPVAGEDAPTRRARRRPWAILGVWAWLAVFALVADWPGVSLARAAYGNDPRGDAPLWAAGSHALLDLLWHDAHGVSAAAGAASVLLVAGAIVGLVPTAALMVGVAGAIRAEPALGPARIVARALRAFPSLAVMLVVVGVAQALAIGAAFATEALVEAWTHGGLGEARAQQLGATIAFVFVLGALALGVMHDLARAAVVRFRLSAFRALALAARIFRRTPVSLCWSWGWRALASLAPIAAAALLAGSLGGRGGIALVVLALVHQGVILARVALRASWLATALRAVDGVPGTRRSRS